MYIYIASLPFRKVCWQQAHQVKKKYMERQKHRHCKEKGEREEETWT